MQRDMELAREILLKIEEQNDPNKSFRIESTMDGYTEVEIMYHVKILKQANFVEAIEASSPRHLYLMVTGLTWQGHEFLDTVRNETIWNETKEIVKQKGGSIAFDLLKALALQVAAKHFGL